MKEPPEIAAGTEFLGRYQGSGIADPPYLVRRDDGRVLQLSRLLYLTAEEVASGAPLPDVAARIGERFGRPVRVEDVRYLVERKLRPIGLVTGPEAATAPPRRPPDVLALRFRRAVLPPRASAAVGGLLQGLFAAPLVLIALAALVALDAWLFAVHGVGDALRGAILHPAQLLAVAALMILAGVVHELGHAAACRRGGATPGAIGVGIYLIWPAFYTDVTDVYRLDRAGRLRTDLGGLHFNVLFALGLAGAFAVTGWPLLLVAIVALQAQMLNQFMPWLRLDGYYVVSDLAGVPDLFTRIKPVLRSLLPGRDDPRARELTRRARLLVTGWVVTAIPVLLALAALLAIHLPGFVATLGDSVAIQMQAIGGQDDGAPARLLALLELGILLTPLLGGLLATAALARALARRARRPRDGRAPTASAVPPGRR